MINDSVREELAARITRGQVSLAPAKPEHISVPSDKSAPPESPPVERTKPQPMKEHRPVLTPLFIKPATERGRTSIASSVPKTVSQIELKPSPRNISTKPAHTSEIVINNTNRTLIEFQPQETKIPEWRLKLQNVVQQRQKTREANYVGISARGGAVSRASGVTAEAAQNVEAGDNRVIASALNRIELSRSKYLISSEPDAALLSRTLDRPREKVKKQYPFSIAATPDTTTDSPGNSIPGALRTPPGKSKSAPLNGDDRYDTNELDPDFPEASLSTSLDHGRLPLIDDRTALNEPIEKTHPALTEVPDPESEKTEDLEEFDDFAPMALRFNAGLFDVIIGSFLTLILLSPVVLMGETLVSITGFFGFLAGFSVVMFVYLTATIGLFGKSFGMHLFSLEMLDLGGDVYPTFHQAAVSSSVYILSLALCGIGFLTALFDKEGRAAHDLASGTIIVKEL